MSESVFSSPPRVAVLLASYNGAKWISEQIESILRQDGVLIHIFVSDDGSKDGTNEILSQYPADQLTVLPTMRAGGAGQNFLRLLRDAPWQGFDYVSFADQDDVWFQDKIIRAVSAIERMNLDAYSSNVTAFWPDGREMLIDKAQPQRRMDHLFEAAGPGNTYVFPKHIAADLKERLDATDPALVAKVALHDWLFYTMIRGAGKKWFVDPTPSIHYRQHDENVMGSSHGIAAIRRRLGMLFGPWYFDQVLIQARIAAITGVERDFLEKPSLSGLKYMLAHLRDFRRKSSEATVLAPAFIWYKAKRITSAKEKIE